MKILNFSLKQIVFFAACVLALVFFLYIAAFYLFQNKTPKPIPGDFKVNYTNFNELSPGKDTKKDIISKNGNYDSEKRVDGKTYLFYKTPSDTIQNVAVLENNVLLYATEEVFAGYRGSPEDFTKKYGMPELTMHDKNDDVIEWSVYPRSGVAVAVAPFEHVITKITYFIPQSKEDFIKNLADELGLVENPAALPTEPIEYLN